MAGVWKTFLQQDVSDHQSTLVLDQNPLHRGTALLLTLSTTLSATCFEIIPTFCSIITFKIFSVAHWIKENPLEQQAIYVSQFHNTQLLFMGRQGGQSVELQTPDMTYTPPSQPRTLTPLSWPLEHRESTWLHLRRSIQTCMWSLGISAKSSENNYRQSRVQLNPLHL